MRMIMDVDEYEMPQLVISRLSVAYWFLSCSLVTIFLFQKRVLAARVPHNITDRKLENL